MMTGIFLERFALAFAGVVWCAYLLNASRGVILGVAVAMLLCGSGYARSQRRRKSLATSSPVRPVM